MFVPFIMHLFLQLDAFNLLIFLINLFTMPQKSPNDSPTSPSKKLPSIDKPPQNSLLKKKKNGRVIYHDACADDNVTKQKLSNINFKHDDLDEVEKQCCCRRHTFKMQTLKPDLTKYSNYRKSFTFSKPVPNLVNISKEYDKLQGPHIGLATNYGKSFHDNAGDKIERPKPEDLLKTGGPSPFVTSYREGVPGHKTVNQYVKPTNQHVRGDFPLDTRSTYGKSFNSFSSPKPVTEKIPDSLKFSPVWLGETTNKNKFIVPNPEDYSPRAKNVQKLEVNPSYKRQYETTYKNNFLNKEVATCPAKQKLERQIQGKFDNTKDRFSENSDFKSLSPHYHAISTSKHYYV